MLPLAANVARDGCRELFWLFVSYKLVQTTTTDWSGVEAR